MGLDPAIDFHLLCSKDQIKELVGTLDTFSHDLAKIANQTESELQLQKEAPNYQKQLETAQCEPSLQLQKVLYYFQEHLEEITDLNKQALFDLIFFKQVDQEVLLVKELQANSFLAEHCKQFIIGGLNRFSQERSEESNCLLAYLFFIRFLYRINH